MYFYEAKDASAQNMISLQTFAKDVSQQFHVKKTLKNRNFKDGDKITFTLKRKTDGAPMPSQTTKTISPNSSENTNTKDIYFDAVKYGYNDIGKTYTYEVTETAIIAGVKNDSKTHQIVVKVGVNNKGAITASVDYKDDGVTNNNGYNDFENTYVPTGGIELEFKKNITGRKFRSSDQFKFKIEAITSGAPMPATVEEIVKPKAGTSTCTFYFDEIKFGQSHAGKSYQYKVTETFSQTNDTDGTLVKDTTSRYATVKVGKDDGSGTLTTSVAYSSVQSYVNGNSGFTNEFYISKSVKFTKQLRGRKFEEGDRFTFTLKPITANAPKNPGSMNGSLNGGKNKGQSEATVSFPPISFDSSHAGKTYEYQVIETDAKGNNTNPTSETLTVYLKPYYDTNGTLKVQETWKGNDAVLVNDVDTTVELEFTKSLLGRNFKSGETFTFTLVAN